MFFSYFIYTSLLLGVEREGIVTADIFDLRHRFSCRSDGTCSVLMVFNIGNMILLRKTIGAVTPVYRRMCNFDMLVHLLAFLALHLCLSNIYSLLLEVKKERLSGT